MDNLILINGDDTYEKEIKIGKIKKEYRELIKGINYILIDKENISKLESELMTYSFFDGKKLIIVKLPKKNQKKEENKENKEKNEEETENWQTDELLEQLENIPNNIQLIFVEDGINKSKLTKKIEEYGQIITLKKEKQNMQKWIIEKLHASNVTINSQEVMYLLELCGNDKQVLTNEIDKLVSYIEPEKKITHEAIEKICIRTPEVIIFELTDSMGIKNKKRALTAFEDLLETKEPIQKISIMLAKHFKTMLLAKEALRQKKNVAQELNIKEYPAMKYSNQSSNFKVQELIDIFRELAKLDTDSKTGNMDLKIGLQKIICK